MKYGYARVSTDDQNPALQIEALKRAGQERLANPEVAQHYLNDALDESIDAFVKALKTVSQARQVSKATSEFLIASENPQESLGYESDFRCPAVVAVKRIRPQACNHATGFAPRGAHLPSSGLTSAFNTFTQGDA